MDMQKMILGTLSCAVGLFIWLYLVVWMLFIGGVVDIIAEIRAVEFAVMNVSIGVAKMLLAGVIGVLVWFSLLDSGIEMIREA